VNGEGGVSPPAAWRVGIVAALVAAIFVFKLVVVEPGPLYLIPVLLAAFWFGPFAGAGLGALCGALYGIGNELNPGDGMEEEEVLVPALIRIAIYGTAGAIVGSLSRSRARLEDRVVEAERELVEMRTIQEALAPPEPPLRPGLDLATCYLPAEHGVAGDFYFVGPGSDGSTVVAIGDVAGRGLAAAKRAWFVRTVLASSAEFTPDPSQLLELANFSLVEESGPTGDFVTAACLVVVPEEGIIRWAVAGHDLPVLLDKGESPPGEGRGLPLGVNAQVGCMTSTLSLEPGAGVLLYTDGLTEARLHDGNGRLQLFGPERVGNLVSELAGEPPERIVDGLRDAAQAFTGGPLRDDLCIVAARTSPRPEATSVC
jgi:phosphoserine phosphatase RsbU/P